MAVPLTTDRLGCAAFSSQRIIRVASIGRWQHLRHRQCLHVQAQLPHLATSGKAAVREVTDNKPGLTAEAPAFRTTAQELVALLEEAFYREGAITEQACDLCSRISTSLTQGLSDQGPASLDARRAQFGANELPNVKKTTFLQLLWEAMDDFTVKMLMGAGVLSIVLNAMHTGGGQAESSVEGWAILGTVLVVVGITVTTNQEKERKFQALNVVKDTAMVRVLHALFVNP